MRMHLHMPKIRTDWKIKMRSKMVSNTLLAGSVPRAWRPHSSFSTRGTRCSHVEMAGQSLRARVEYVQFHNRVAPLAILNLNADVHGAAIPPQAPRGPRQVATNHLRSCSQNTSVGAALWLGAHASQYMP